MALGNSQSVSQKETQQKIQGSNGISASVANGVKVLRTTRTSQFYFFFVFIFECFVDLLTSALASADALMRRHRRSRSMFPFASHVLSILLKLDTNTNCANVLVIIIYAAAVAALRNFDIQVLYATASVTCRCC